MSTTTTTTIIIIIIIIIITKLSLCIWTPEGEIQTAEFYFFKYLQSEKIFQAYI
jgi:hypothetical protein